MAKFVEMRILVTGGAGFIGSHLVDRLVDKGDVVVVDDLTGGYQRNLNKGADFYRIDLRNQLATKNLLSWFKPNIIYHLAANAAENKAQFSPYDIASRNFDTFLTLTHAINGELKKFIYTSSIAVYGEQETPYPEDLEPKPEDLYGISKHAVERSLQVLAKVHGFDYVITRPHNVYGPRQDMADPYRNVVTIFMNAVLKDEPYYIYGDGEQRRCFTYIDGVTDALVKCLDVKEGVFNLGADKDYSINELSDTIMKITGHKKKPINLPDRAQEVKVATADHTKAKKILGYREGVSLEEGIRKTWEYAKKLGPQEVRKTGFEIMSDKIPSNWL